MRTEKKDETVSFGFCASVRFSRSETAASGLMQLMTKQTAMNAQKRNAGRRLKNF